MDPEFTAMIDCYRAMCQENRNDADAEQFAELLVSVVERMTRSVNTPDRDELTQQVVIKIWQQAERQRIQDPQALPAFVRRTVSTTTIDIARAAKRRSQHLAGSLDAPVADTGATGVTLADVVASPTPDPHEQLAGSVSLWRLECPLRVLAAIRNHRHRRCIELWISLRADEAWGDVYEQVADDCELSLNNAQVIINRYRKKVKVECSL